MNKLFIYGTLIDSEIQKEIIGRELKLSPQILSGYKKSKMEVSGTLYPLIVSDINKEVKGFIVEITDEELQKIDAYETNAYKRMQINLKNRERVWVYVENENL